MKSASQNYKLLLELEVHSIIIIKPIFMRTINILSQFICNIICHFRYALILDQVGSVCNVQHGLSFSNTPCLILDTFYAPS